MEEGYVSLKSINMVIYGPPGVGKTSFQDLLCGEPPHKEYKSTPIARPIQAIEKIAANGDKSWGKVTENDLLEALRAAIQEDKPIHTTVVTPSVDTGTTPKTEDNKKHSSSATNNTSPMDKDYTSDIIAKLAGRKGSQKLLEATWIHLLDSGGQPQFADLLHMFVRDNSLYIIVMKATESLDDKPVIVYSCDGTPVSNGNQATQASPHMQTKMIMTNLQNIKNFVCSVIKASRSTIKAGSEVINQPPTPAFAIIATHYDEYKIKHKETLEKKNKILKDCFKDISGHFVFYCDCEKHDTNSNECQLIFPVNNHCESKDRESLSAGIRKRFMSRFCTFVPQEIPACYYIFEIKMNKPSEKKESCGMISKDSCVKEIGKKLGMNESEVKDCLKYLDSLRICIYYPNIIPHVVFTSPQFLIDCLSKIVRVSIVNDVQQILPEGVTLSTKAIRNLKGSGIFDKSLLDNLGLTFIPNLFTKDNLLSLLEHCHIVSPIPADTTPKQYFMPTLLPPKTLTDEEKKDLTKGREQLIIASPDSPLEKVHAYTVTNDY